MSAVGVVAELSGFGALRLIRMIVEAAKMAHMHKQNCRQFAQHLELVGNLLEQLRISELHKYPETREPLKQLEESLERSYILVNGCRHKSYFYLLTMGWNIVRKFREAHEEIDRYLKIIPLIALVDSARVKENIKYIEMDQSDYILEDEDMIVQDGILQTDPWKNASSWTEETQPPTLDTLSSLYPELSLSTSSSNSTISPLASCPVETAFSFGDFEFVQANNSVFPTNCTSPSAPPLPAQDQRPTVPPQQFVGFRASDVQSQSRQYVQEVGEPSRNQFLSVASLHIALPNAEAPPNPSQLWMSSHSTCQSPMPPPAQSFDSPRPVSNNLQSIHVFPHTLGTIQQIHDKSGRDFLRMDTEHGDGGEGNILGQFGKALEERKAILRLEAMGFDLPLVLKVFLICNKNEEQAANYLLDHMHK